jgi:UDP-galactopyranose mutase
MEVDYLVVGSGLTGSVLARILADRGREVVVVDRRSHGGGNVHDQLHPSGIRIHTYGPHYFRTSSDRIWEFANRFAPFFKYQASVMSLVDGQLEHWPIAASYIRRRVGPEWRPEFVGTPANFEQAALALMPRVVYEKFVKPYNEKQWGVPAEALSPELCTRFDVRMNDEPRLTPHARYQGIPIPGYAEWMRRMIEGIPLYLDFDYLDRRSEITARRKLIFTGPIDAYFDYDLGKLPYRGQHRQHTYLSDVQFGQQFGQINNPQHEGGRHIRTLEWKRMMEPAQAAGVRGTVLTTETPLSATDINQYEYPLPAAESAALYRRYRERAEAMPNVLICGRLGEYRYFDMDQAIGRAMMLAEKLLAKDHAGAASASVL